MWTYDVAKYTRTNIASVAVHKSYFSGGPFAPHRRFAPLYPIYDGVYMSSIGDSWTDDEVTKNNFLNK